MSTELHRVPSGSRLVYTKPPILSHHATSETSMEVRSPILRRNSQDIPRRSSQDQGSKFTQSEIIDIGARQLTQLERQKNKLLFLKREVQKRRLTLSQYQSIQQSPNVAYIGSSKYLQDIWSTYKALEKRLQPLLQLKARYEQTIQTYNLSVNELHKAHDVMLHRREELRALTQCKQHYVSVTMSLHKLPRALANPAECDRILATLQSELSGQQDILQNISVLVNQYRQLQGRFHLLYGRSLSRASMDSEMVTWSRKQSLTIKKESDYVIAVPAIPGTFGLSASETFVMGSPAMNRRQPIIPVNMHLNTNLSKQPFRGGDVADRVIGRYSPPAYRRPIPLQTSTMVTAFNHSIGNIGQTNFPLQGEDDDMETSSQCGSVGPKVMRRATSMKYANSSTIRDTYLHQKNERREELIRSLRETAVMNHFTSDQTNQLDVDATPMGDNNSRGILYVTPPTNDSQQSNNQVSSCQHADSGLASLQNSVSSSECTPTTQTFTQPSANVITSNTIVCSEELSNVSFLNHLPPPSPLFTSPTHPHSSEMISQTPTSLSLPLPCSELNNEEDENFLEEDVMSDSLSQEFSDSLSLSPTIATAEVDRASQQAVEEEGSVKAIQRHHHRIHEEVQLSQSHTPNNESKYIHVIQNSSPSLLAPRSILKRRPSHSELHPSDKPVPRGRHIQFNCLVLLLDATLSGDLELVQKISLEMNDVSEPNEDGITALHNAICANHLDISRYLITYCAADVNAQEADGWTPLHCAASCNSLAMCRLLVEHGAALLVVTTGDGETALEKCTEQQDASVLSGLTESSPHSGNDDPDGTEDSVSGGEVTKSENGAAHIELCEKYLRDQEIYLWSESCSVLYSAFNYTPENDDELPLYKNQQLQVIDRQADGEDFWFRARCLSSGRVGFVPKSFVSAYPLIVERQCDALTSSSISTEQSVC